MSFSSLYNRSKRDSFSHSFKKKIFSLFLFVATMVKTRGSGVHAFPIGNNRLGHTKKAWKIVLSLSFGFFFYRQRGGVVVWLFGLCFVLVLLRWLIDRQQGGVKGSFWSVYLVLCFDPCYFWDAFRRGSNVTLLFALIWFVFAGSFKINS